jgi:hypothetical protein
MKYFLASSSTSTSTTTKTSTKTSNFPTRSTLLPYGLENGDSSMGFFDDDSVGPINFNEPFYINDSSFDAFYICSNGFISNSYSTAYTFTDFNLPSIPIIGPLLIDLKNNGNSSIYYRQTSNQTLLNQIKNTIMETRISQYSSFTPNWAFIVTWKDISIYGYAESTNTFQLVLTTDNNCRSFALFNYDKLNIPENKISTVKAGYTLGDTISYLSISDKVQIFLNDTRKLPSSLVYLLNSLPNCSALSSTTKGASTRTSLPTTSESTLTSTETSKKS